MVIEEIIFFLNNKSNKSVHVQRLIEQYGIPVTYFDVKDEDTAKLLRQGNKFKVYGVPTIVVLYNHNKLKKYEGEECINFVQFLNNENQNLPDGESYEDED